MYALAHAAVSYFFLLYESVCPAALRGMIPGVGLYLRCGLAVPRVLPWGREPSAGKRGAAVLRLLSKTPCVSLTPFVTSSLSPRNT